MPSNTQWSRSVRQVTLRCDAADTCCPNNLCQPLLEKVYLSKRNSTPKSYTVKSTSIRISSCCVEFHSIGDLLKSSDESLIIFIWYNPQHVLHQILPPHKHTGYNLHSRGHGIIFSVIPSEFMRKNFVNRLLFNNDIILILYRQDCILFALLFVYVYIVSVCCLFCVWQNFY